MPRRIFIPLICIVLLVAGCKSHSKITKPTTPPVTQEQQQGQIHQQEPQKPEEETKPNCPFEYLSGNFTCEVAGFNVNGQLRMQCDSAIWVTGTKIIELGRAKCTHDSVFVYVKLRNIYFKGTYADIKKKTGYETDFATLQQMVCDAYTSEKKQLALTIKSRVYNGRITATFNKMDTSQKLTFPIAIPSNAKPL